MSTVCRVCLTSSDKVDLRSIEDIRIRDIYTKLTDTQFYTEDSRPRVVCIFCNQKLLKCWILMDMASKSENKLSILLYRKTEPTFENIKKLNMDTKQYLKRVTMPSFDVDKKNPNISNVIKDEELVKEEETSQLEVLNDCDPSEPVFDLVDTDSNNTEEFTSHVSHNTSQVIFQEESASIKEKPVSQLVHTESADTEVQQDVQMVETASANTKEKQNVEIVDTTDTNETQEVASRQLIYEEDSDDSCLLIDVSTDLDVDQLMCQKNSRILHSNQELSQNQKIHPDMSNTFCCKICNKKFLDQSTLDSHIQLTTKEQECKNYEQNDCSMCHRTFKYYSQLLAHMNTHTKVKKFSCVICDKRYKHQSSLSKHMHIHTSKKPFQTNC